jgi:hypothetical protein
MSVQTLTSLAILTVNWDRGRDIVSSFVPLVAECIRSNGSQPVALVDLQQAVEREVGIRIPSGALQAILARCAKEKLVRRQHHVYVPDRKKLDALDFAPARAEALRQHQCLLDKLRAFARDRYDVDWSAEDADRNVLNYLQEGSLPVLAAATEGDPLPPSREHSRKARHILGSFARHLDEADPDGFACLETVVKGHILSGVLFYPDIRQVEARFHQLDVYCDTPFLLPALGYSEEGVQAQCLDLIDLLRDLGAHLKCFHHTREEVVGVLEAEALRRRPGVSSTEPPDYMTSKHLRLGEIEEMIVKIDDTLSGLGISVVDTPPWTERPDEVALDEKLKESIDYYRDRAREKDVQSLAAIARLRKLRRVDKFESADAIFVTTNIALVRASSEFFEELETGRAIPVCMPVSLMTRLAWVKKPMVAPNLPRHMVMASAYAAINPSVPLWRKCLEEIEHRRAKGDIGDEEYHFLRSSREAREALMDATFGGEEAFSAGTLDEVIAHAKATIQAEARAETAAERQARVAAEDDARSAREASDRIARAYRSRVAVRARRIALVVGWAFAVLFGTAVVVGALATIPGFPLVDVKSTGWRAIIWLCIAAFFCITLYAIVVRHVPVLGIRRAVSSAVERRLRDRGYRFHDDLEARAVDERPLTSGRD